MGGPSAEASSRAPTLPVRPFWLAPWIVAGVFTLVVGSIAHLRHLSLGTHTFDLAVYDQTVWMYSRGRLPYSSILGMGAWSDHFSPILILLAPLDWVWRGAAPLLWAQALLLGLAAVPLAHLARRRTGSPGIALALAAAFALSPYLRKAALDDFHDVAFHPLLFLGAAWAIEESREGLFVFLGALLLGVRNDAFLSSGALVLWAAFSGRKRPAALLGLLLVVEVALAQGLLLPTLDGGIAQRHQSEWYGRFGATPLGILAGIALHPVQAVWAALEPRGFVELGKFLSMVWFLPLAAPEGLLLLPSAMESLLSTYAPLHALRYYYALPLFGPAFLAASSALGRRRRLLESIPRKTLIALLLLPPVTQLAHFAADLRAGIRLTPEAAAFRSIAAGIPPDLAVSAQNPLGPHVAHRERLYAFPATHAADLVLLDRSDDWPLTPTEYAEAVGRLPGRYALEASAGPYQVWKIRSAP